MQSICTYLCAAAGYIQNHLKDLCADVLDGGGALGDAAGINVNQVGPALRERSSGCHFDNRRHREAIGGSASGGEDVQVHACCQLKCPTDEITGGRSRKEEPFVCDALARTNHTCNRAAAGLGDRTQSLFYNVRDSAGLVSRCWISAAIDATSFQIPVIPTHFANEVPRHRLVTGPRGHQGKYVTNFTHFRE